MTSQFNKLLTVFGILGSSIIFTNISHGDPLFGEIPKFAQEPMIATTIPGQLTTFFGHDELSTAYGVGTAAQPPLNYQGTFMADDFSDKVSQPVVHITWWGSYMNASAAPQPPVQKFLIAFESDVPAQPGTFSHPGSVLQWEVVTPGTLTPGTFTETLERPKDPVLGEALYRYNAELAVPFPEQKDTVYWLKIAALVDVPQPVVVPIPPGITQWGWHNRDYTIQDTLASAVPVPGEFVEGVVAGQPVWHFQDDAVQGDLRFTPGAPVGQQVVQLNPKPQNYVFVNSAGAGPIDGPVGIDVLSKDLAFRLYTNVPEPATCSLVALGLAAMCAIRRRSA